MLEEEVVVEAGDKRKPVDKNNYIVAYTHNKNINM
jgi:hypothetical protein